MKLNLFCSKISIGNELSSYEGILRDLCGPIRFKYEVQPNPPIRG